jgi:hypothetical protein
VRATPSPRGIRASWLAAATLSVTAVALTAAAPAGIRQAGDDAFLGWARGDAAELVDGMRRVDRIGNRMSMRGLKTDRAINYKMRATWLTPDVIRATARALQLDERLGPDDARRLVAEADAVADTVFFIEIDPYEGSGVVPLEWAAILQPRGLPRGEAGAARGTLAPKLRDVRALGGLFKRDYAYDAFWVTFSFTPAERASLFGPGVTDVELVVNIQGREGSVTWPIPSSMRERLRPR